MSVEAGPDLKTLSPEERVRYGDQKRLRGNDLYSRDDFHGAIQLYSRGVSYLEGSDDESVMAMKIKVLNNLSAAQLKVSFTVVVGVWIDGKKTRTALNPLFGSCRILG